MTKRKKVIGIVAARKKKRKYTKRSPKSFLSKPRKDTRKWIHLHAFVVTGMQFYNIGTSKGEHIILRPIDNNAFDPFAIEVRNSNDEQIGWFPRETVNGVRSASKLQIALHRALKAGMEYRAVVTQGKSQVVVSIEVPVLAPVS